MRECDLADSPLAATTHTPADECDSPVDHIAEPLMVWSHRQQFPLAFRTPQELSSVVLPHLSLGLAALEAANSGLPFCRASDAAAHFNAALDFLWDAAPRECRIRITLIRRRLLQVEGRSLDEIGTEYGLCRQAVLAKDQKLREYFPGSRIRADKPDHVREECRARRTGKKKPPVPDDVHDERLAATAKVLRERKRAPSLFDALRRA